MYGRSATGQTPLTYATVTLLKLTKGMDVCDVDTDFNPISFR